MSVCDAHGAFYKSNKKMSPDEGYLLAARFAQNSIIQDKLVDNVMPVMQRMGFTREQYKLKLESSKGTDHGLFVSGVSAA